jgi:H+/gluconate symporter-like permease
LDQTFMGGAAQFLAQFFPLCLLGAAFGKVMEDSGSSAGTLDSLPYNGAVVTLLAVCGMTHRESNRDIVMVAIVSALLALAAVIVLGSIFGSF